MQRAFVTGAAGFIGSSSCDRLLQKDWEVVGWDNFSTGQAEFVESAKQHSRFRLVTGDNLDPKYLTETMAGASVVFHLAANADVRFGSNIRGEISSKIRSRRSMCWKRCGAIKSKRSPFPQRDRSMGRRQ